MLLQNGSGEVEKVNEQFFTDLDTRPGYITGVISHDVTLNSPFDITRTDAFALSLGPIPRQISSIMNSRITPSHSSSYLLETLPLIPRFNARVKLSRSFPVPAREASCQCILQPFRCAQRF